MMKNCVKNFFKGLVAIHRAELARGIQYQGK